MTPDWLNPTRAPQDRQGQTPSREPHSRADLTAALGDIAFVLHLTRRVWAEIMNEAQQPALAAA